MRYKFLLRYQNVARYWILQRAEVARHQALLWRAAVAPGV
jgi:hypothetical protein